MRIDWAKNAAQRRGHGAAREEARFLADRNSAIMADRYRAKASTGWAVVRVNEDGRRELVNQGMCALAAEKVAGALRDASGEIEIRDGWNYQAVNGTEPIGKDQGPDSGLCFTSMQMFDARWRTDTDREPGPMNTPDHQATSDSLRRSREAVKDQPRRGLGRSGERRGAPLTSTGRRG